MRPDDPRAVRRVARVRRRDGIHEQAGVLIYQRESRLGVRRRQGMRE
jgi:hypothetical protein